MANTTRIHAPSRLMILPAAVAIGLQFLWAVPMVAQSATGSSADPASAQAGGTAGGAGFGGSPAARGPRQAIGCMIGPERLADIGTPVTGVISDVQVERGDTVRKGQVLVVLDHEVEQAGVQAAKARSAIDADIHAAEANLVLARQRYDRLVSLDGSGSVPTQSVEQALAERDVAAQKLAQARAQKQVQAHELGIVRAQLGQRTLRSPFNGVVAERFANPGERVEDKPLLRVAQLDPLRVELVMPAARWGSLARGDKLGVLPDLPGASTVLARVSHVDRMLDPASNTFRVRLSLPNPGHKLPAGARCKVDAPAPEVPPLPPAASASSAAITPVALRPAALRPAGLPRLKFTI